ncbi:hypothetical protein VTK26DRAFT_1512 [Humicola hyalothermophila]
MAQRDAAFNPSSPHSSSAGAESYNHEGLNINGPSGHNVHFHVNPVDGFSNIPAATDKDPFISTAATPKGGQKLSPTASAFRPVSVPLVARGSLARLPLTDPAFDANRQLYPPHATAAFSSDLGISRCLVLYAISHPVQVADVEGYFQKLEQLGLPFRSNRNIIEKEGKVYLHFSNIREARTAHDNAKFESADWCSEYLATFQFNQFESIYEGQVQITALGQGANFVSARAETVVRAFLEAQGEVFAFQRQTELNDNIFRALVEFSDADISNSIVQKFNGMTVGGIQLILAPRQQGASTTMLEPLENHHHIQSHAHSVAGMFQNMGATRTPQLANPLAASNRLVHPSADFHAPQQIAMYPPVIYQGLPPAAPNRFMLNQTPTRSQSVGTVSSLSPMTAGMPLMAPVYTPPATPMALQGGFTSPRSIQPYGRFDNRRQNAMRVNRSPYYNATSHHNHVDVNRIRDGIDVRTTIMLRNIPNKVDQAMLKRIVDESSWGKYDFMYLRIDFANDCNVGYAFINFVDGKDCLVQKFRNSSVMLEAPHYRPKLYYTSNGPRPELAGQEEPFPEPDNQSKMKRSCENAEHVGLFTPNAGQHFRDEQRRRRSQYDRGTRLAALEEYDYEAHMHPQGFFGPH